MWFSLTDRWQKTRSGQLRRRWSRPVMGCERLEPRLLLSFDPSPIEQEVMESINRMRTDPQDELGVLFSSLSPYQARDADVQQALNHFGFDASMFLAAWSQLDSVPPVAWNEALSDAARAHNELMRDFDQQAHQLPGEPDLGQRVSDAGYPLRKATENIYAFAESAMHGHAGFVIDWGDGPGGVQDPPGHRNNYMDLGVIEVGISVIGENNPLTSVGPLLITQDFGFRRNYGNPQVLGVVYEDDSGNGWYDAGDGIGNVTIEVSGPSGTFTTTTMSAGGYQLHVPPGTYQVTASGFPLSQTLVASNIVVGDDNVKVDFETDSADILPKANPDSGVVAEDGQVTINVLQNDVSTTGTLVPNSVQIVTPPQAGSVWVNPSTGSVTYQPQPNFSGSDSFWYTVRNSRGAVSDAARVTMTVNGVNDPPVGLSFEVATDEEVPLEIDMTPYVSDLEGSINWNSLRAVEQPSHGFLGVNTATRKITYYPQLDFQGTDEFFYSIADAEGQRSLPQRVTITVHNINDAPKAVADTVASVNGGQSWFNVLANDIDVDSNLALATVALTSPAVHGSAVIVDGRIRYTADPFFVGMDTLRYNVRDNEGRASNGVAVSIYVADARHPWRNPVDRYDVNVDGVVSPVDALTVINHLGTDLGTVGGTDARPPFLDIDGDGAVSPLDALLAINQLGDANAASASSSAVGVALAPAPQPVPAVGTHPRARHFDTHPQQAMSRAARFDVLPRELQFVTGLAMGAEWATDVPSRRRSVRTPAHSPENRVSSQIDAVDEVFHSLGGPQDLSAGYVHVSR